MKTTNPLTIEYAQKIRPLVSTAQKAYGAKTQNTPAHRASREYTQLLVEFVDKGGSLMELATELGVAYSGIRRRVFTANVPTVTNGTARVKHDPETIEAAVARVLDAKSRGTDAYHKQLTVEYYENNISLGQIAKGLGISNAAPLYYGVQRHLRSTPRPASL
jgi:hypothetical protein